MLKRSLLGAGMALVCACLLISSAVARSSMGGHLGGPSVRPPSNTGPVSHAPSSSRVPFVKIRGPRQCYHVCRGLSGTTPAFCAQSCYF